MPTQEELEQTQQRLTERDRQIAEMNHRIFNTLQITSSYIQIQKKRVTDPSAREVLDAVQSRIMATAYLHRHLHEQDTDDQVDLKQFLEGIVPAIGASTGVDTVVEVAPVMIESHVGLHLLTIIIELVMNARKHAYAGRDGGTVAITCQQDGDYKLRLTVADDGDGVPSDFDPRQANGLGMKVINSIIDELSGTLDVGRCKGACFIITLPVAR